MNFNSNISKIEKIIGYTFKDKSLLAQAFTRTSFCNEHKDRGDLIYQSNEVLEFFGDGVLSVAIISFMLNECTKRYAHGISTELDEGAFSNIKSKLSDKKNLSKSTYALGLQNYLRIGEGDAKLGIINEPSVMEDLFESIIGAVYIDCDMDIKTVMNVVAKMLDVSEYISSTPPIQSAKNALQEWCADKKIRLPQPVYKTVSESGPDHKKEFERGCYIGDRLVATAKGKNLKIADAKVAEITLEILKSEYSKKPNSAEKPAQKKKSTDAPSPKAPAKKVAKTAKKKPNTTDNVNKSIQNDIKRPTKSTNSMILNKAKSKPKVLTSTGSAASVLKIHAATKKYPAPLFRDLGEVRSPRGTEYKIECSMAGVTKSAVAGTKVEARELSAKMVAKELKIKI